MTNENLKTPSNYIEMKRKFNVQGFVDRGRYMKDLCMREYTILNDTNKGEVQKGGTSEIRPSK